MPAPGLTTYPGFMTYPGAGAPIVYEGGPLPQAIALGIGVGGALVDVSRYVAGPEGITYGWGRQDEFRDPSPGQITFTLENQDGRFTPGNPSTPLATPLTEGTNVVWSLNGRLVQMQVISIGFASSEDQWGRVTIQCSDGLNIANRTTLGDLAGAAAAANAYLWWPMTDLPGATVANEISGNPALALGSLESPIGLVYSTLAFGQTSTGPTTDTQLLIQANEGGYTGEETNVFGNQQLAPSISYPAGSLGAWGFWWTPQGVEVLFAVIYATSAGPNMFMDITPGGVVLTAEGSGAPAVSQQANFSSDGAQYIAFSTTYSGTAATTNFYVNGVLISSLPFTLAAVPTPATLPSSMYFSLPPGYPYEAGIGLLSHLSHTATVVHEEAAGTSTEAARFALLAATVPQITVGTVDPNLSTAPVAQQNTSGSAAFTAFADLLRTEQGHFYFATAGSLLAPSTTFNFRSRVRSLNPAQSFDAQVEVSGVPQFLRDITNMYSTVTATGPSNSATVVDPTMIPRVGTAYVSETVILANTVDLTSWAQDRLIRGENVNLRIASLTIDTLNVPSTQQAATVAKLMALLPGDRIRVTNLPGGPLGFTTWDGWFLGGSEAHNYLTDAFTLYLAPVLPATGIFDTDLFANSGEITLAAALTAAAATATVTSPDGVTWFERTAVPYTLLIDQEQVIVTAAAAPSATAQTITITRGVNGTTAAAHAIGAAPEVVSSTNLFAF